MHSIGHRYSHGSEKSPAGTSATPPLPAEMAAFASQVRRFTNYEVWKGVETAMVALAPNQEPDTAEWSNLRILLDELKWRLSGLEGAGTPPSRNQVDIRPH
jgi:hypothetical protein